MDIVFVLLPAAIVLALIGLGGFLWAARKGQFEDLDTPAVRVLFDDAPVQSPGNNVPTHSKSFNQDK